MRKVIQPEIRHKHIYLTQGIVYDSQEITGGEIRDLHISLLTPYGIRSTDKKKLPCVVWVCGGAWRGGKERAAEMLPELLYLAENGYIVAAVEYRILKEAVFPAQIQDVLTGVRFLKTNADKYGIDPERIGIMGSSAGGHLTLLAANNDGQFDTDKYPGVNSIVKCAVDFYGITDIEEVYHFNLKRTDERIKQGRAADPHSFPECELLGDLPDNVPELAKKAGGINGINVKTCPVLVMHGDSDRTVNIGQSELYYNAMTQQEKEISYYVIHGADHGSNEFFQEEVHQIVLGFLNEKL